jgi:hypothetical protein
VASIHLIERTDNVRKTDKTKNEWESGNWVVSEEVAQKLIGGSLYLHRGKQHPSHFGGKILSYRVEQSGPAAGLVVFTVKATMDCKDVKTDRKGWSKDQKIFADTPVPEHS